VQLASEFAAVSDPEIGKGVLVQTKRFAEFLQALSNEVFIGGDKTTELGKAVTESVGELLGQLRASNDLLSELNEVPTKVRNLNEILYKQSQPTGRPFAEIKDNIITAVRSVTAAGSALRASDFSRVGSVTLQARTLARTLPSLLSNVRDATQTIPDEQLRQKITESTNSLIEQVAILIVASKKTLENSNNLGNQAELDSAFSAFGEGVKDLLNLVKRGALGESKIDDSVEVVSNVVAKIGALSIFASAGQEFEGVKKLPTPYADQVKKLAAEAPKITNIIKTLSAPNAAAQDQLGDHVTSFAGAINALLDGTIVAAASATNSSDQQAALASARAVGLSAKQVMLSAKDAQKNPSDTTARSTFDAALAGFTRTLDQYIVNTSGGRDQSAHRQLDAAKERLTTVQSMVDAVSNATAATVLDSARAIQNATASLIFVSNADELVEATNMAMVSIEDFLANVKGAADAKSGVGLELSENAKTVVQSMVTLLEAAKGSRDDQKAVSQVDAASAAVNNSLASLVTSLQKLPPNASGLQVLLFYVNLSHEI
jgi:hypothetical protein